jgi:hypothetical protein
MSGWQEFPQWIRPAIGERCAMAGQDGQPPISDKVLPIIKHPGFKRLSSINQIGLIERGTTTNCH